MDKIGIRDRQTSGDAERLGISTTNSVADQRSSDRRRRVSQDESWKGVLFQTEQDFARHSSHSFDLAFFLTGRRKQRGWHPRICLVDWFIPSTPLCIVGSDGDII